MGLVELFGVASMPVIKVLIITAVGLLLALDNVNLLGKDARIQVNHLVHYVFNPALVGGNLADTITFENVVLLWFMPVNILLTFIIGSALGWILIKLTRAPKHLEGLILGVGAVYIWTYVYNIMRVSASVVPKDDYRTSSFRLEASGEFLEFIPEEESSEPENPPKDNMDDYTLLLSSIESEENVKLPISAKIKQQFGNLLVNSNFRAIFSPATLGAIVGFIVGVVPQIRKLMIGGDASLHVIQDSVTMVGLEGSKYFYLDSYRNYSSSIYFPANFGYSRATQLGLVQPDPLYQFVLLLQYALPPAMAIGTIAQLFGAGEGECSVIMLWTYVLASVAVTFWTTYFMWLVA
ncbi:Protein PIN-LIKES 3 [Glycine max]|nr:Protein PIN-LIKES 3 [Glycine max]KAH1224170.1 Protein PIN-LIKES 3 [Glycine max]